MKKLNENIFKSQFLQSLQRCLIAALLKNTNASSVIYRNLTAMKVVDYCLGGWRCCLVVLN